MDLLASIKGSIIGLDREKVVEFTRKAPDEEIKPKKLLMTTCEVEKETMGISIAA